MNYARWMTRLLNVDNSLKSMLMNGGLSVTRTSNSCKKASPEAEEDLLSIIIEGEPKRDKFTKDAEIWLT